MKVCYDENNEEIVMLYKSDYEKLVAKSKLNTSSNDILEIAKSMSFQGQLQLISDLLESMINDMDNRTKKAHWIKTQSICGTEATCSNCGYCCLYNDKKPIITCPQCYSNMIN